MALKDDVHAAMRNALANGYKTEMMDWPPRDTADDLIAYDDEIAAQVSDLEDPAAELIPHIISWREKVRA